MHLEGIHHVTMITGDAPGNVDFYTRVLGLRLVAKTVNQDDPNVYHLFYADEHGSPGTEMTFFEYPGARRGRAGGGMVHTIVSRVGSPQALDFWADRLTAEGIDSMRDGDRLRFADPEGLGHELAVDRRGRAALGRASPDPARARARRRDRSARAQPQARRERPPPRGRARGDSGRHRRLGTARRRAGRHDHLRSGRHAGRPRSRHRAPRRLGHHGRRTSPLARAPGRARRPLDAA